MILTRFISFLVILSVLYSNGLNAKVVKDNRLPQAMMGFWFGTDQNMAEFFFAPTYFKAKKTDHSLSILGDYKNIREVTDEFQIEGRIGGQDIALQLSWEGEHLVCKYLEHGEVTKIISLSRKATAPFEKVKRMFEEKVTPVVGRSFDEYFEHNHWLDTSWVFPTTNFNWAGNYHNQIRIDRNYIYYRGSIWHYRQAIVTDSVGVFVIENATRGTERYIFLRKVGTRRMLVDFNHKGLTETELVYRGMQRTAVFDKIIRGRYLRLRNGALRGHHASMPFMFSIGDSQCQYQNRKWNFIGSYFSGNTEQLFYRYGDAIQILNFNRIGLHGAISFRGGQINTWVGYSHISLYYFLLSGLVIILLPLFLFIRLVNSKRKIAILQMSVLKSQLNPHFIFNALNSIQSLVNQREVTQTNKYLQQFASLLRGNIDQTNEMTIPIEEELTAIEQYCALESLRKPFEYNLVVDPDVDIYNCEVPPGLLQPIVENSIVHAFPKTVSPTLDINVHMHRRALVFEIEDNGPGKKGLRMGGKGIELVRQRIRALRKAGLMKVKFEESSGKYGQGLCTRITYTNFL